MFNTLGCNYVTDHDWQHCWYDPYHFSNYFIKECVKGPFAEPKLVCDLPVVGYSQRYPVGLKGRTYCSIRALQCSCQKVCASDETMFNNDTCPLKRHYGLPIGHGIPDPWMWPPIDAYIPNFGDLKTEVKKYLNRLTRTHFKGTDDQFHSFLDKKDLFECPDTVVHENAPEATQNNVTVVSSPEQTAVNCGDNCRCIQVIQNWVTENAHLFKNCKENVCDLNKEVQPPANICTCERNSEIGCFGNEEFPEKRKKEPEVKITTPKIVEEESEPKISYNFQPIANEKLKCEGKSCLKKTKVSIAIQTDPVKDRGKTRLGEHEKLKCQCDERCPDCFTYKCARGPPVTSNFCMPLQNSPFTCPYVCPTHYLFQNPRLICSDSKKKKDRRTSSRRKAEELNEGGIQLKHHPKEDLEENNWHIFKDELSGLPQSSVTDFQQLKLLTEKKLKSYLMRKELSNRFVIPREPPSDASPKFTDMYDDKEPETGIPLKRCPTFFHYKLDEILNPSPEYIGKFHRKVGTGRDDAKKETKIKFIKELDSDESNTYGLVRGNQGSRRSIWKRRQLRANRKRRKTLAGLKSSASEKSPILSKRVNKNIQVNDPFLELEAKQSQMHLNLKKVSFDIQPSREIKTREKEQPLRRNLSSVAEAVRRVDYRVLNRKFDKEGWPVDARRQPWEADAVFERISHNSGTTWSTNTLKTIVDDLLLKENTIKDLRKRGRKMLT